MSFVQSRSDKNGAAYYRKTGRSATFNHPRNTSVAYAAKGGSAAPSLSSSSATTRSFDNNAQGVQPLKSFQQSNHQPRSNNDVSAPLQNVACDASVQSQTCLVPSTTAKPAGTNSVPRNGTETAREAPTSQSTSVRSVPTAPATPVKEPGDASKGVTFQFGSISPGLVNRIQIPAGTTSVPPTIEEKQQAQARHDALKSVPAVLSPPAVAEQLPTDILGSTDHSGAAKVHSCKMDPQTQFSSPGIHAQNHPVHEASRMPLPIFHHPQIPVQLSGPNPRIQSPGMLPSSIQMQIPIPMPLANSPPQIQHQMFPSGRCSFQASNNIQPCQSHGLNFRPLAAQMGNLGMGIRQYPQKQEAQYGGPHKMTVKITHPDTRQEVRLDKPSDAFTNGASLSRSQPNVPPQSQPLSSHRPNHQFNYHHGSYASALYLHGPGSLAVPGSQIAPTSQGARFHHPVSQGPQSASLGIPLANTLLHPGKTGFSNQGTVPQAHKEHTQNSHQETSCLPYAVKETIRRPDGSSDLNSTRLSLSYGSAAALKVEPPKYSGKSGESAPKDYEAATAGSLPNHRTNRESASFDLNSGTTENDSTQVSAASCECALSNSSSVDLDSGKHYDVANDCQLPQVDEQAPAISNFISHGSPKVGHEAKEYEQKSVRQVESGLPEVQEVCCNKIDMDAVVDGRIDNSKISTSHDVNESPEEYPSVIDPSGGSDSNRVSSTSASARSESSFELQEKAEADDDVHSTTSGKGGSVQILASNDKYIPEVDRSKCMTTKGKKKRREFLQKADAAGSTSDLYMAYKGPEENMQTIIPAEVAPERFSSKLDSSDCQSRESAASENGSQSKMEPDDWEAAADISTPKLGAVTSGKLNNYQASNGSTAKKYSRDFLLKFAEQCTSLPDSFVVTSSLAEAFQPGENISRSIGRDHHPSHVRPSTGPRLDRRGSNARDDDRWNKVPGLLVSGQDLRLDVGLGGNMGFRSGHGANYGVLRHPYVHGPIQSGGILPGLMQPPGSQADVLRTGSDTDRWQRATNFQQKGLMLSPQIPLQAMHRAEKKYEVGKVTDEEQAKQRNLKAILNKLTPQNFEKLFEQVIDVQIDSAITLTGLISQIFDKALLEPTFCEMYANLCSHLSRALPDFKEGDEKITFKRLLLNKCQEEFERGEKEQEEANKIEEEGEVKQTKEEREVKRINARRRMLGNIRLIGELYKERMLTEKIMHECMKKLLGQHITQIPEEEDLEALCKLMSTIGEMIDHPKAKSHMDAYFERMIALSNNMALSSRVRFMLKDSIDLRKNKWQQRRKVEGPKKIEEVHRDAQQERHAQAGRGGRSHGIMNSGRRGQPREFASRGNPSSSNAQVGSFRSLSMQTRGRSSHEARFDERQTYEPRPLSAPFPHKSWCDDLITLGPQGGLGRGLSVKGPSSAIGTSVSSGGEDGSKSHIGSNGFGFLDRSKSYSSREDSATRFSAESYVHPMPTDQLNAQGGMDRSPRYSFDRPSSASLSQRNEHFSTSKSTSEKIWPEEKFRDKSIAAIREYYSVKDEKELTLCIEDLKSPSFYPSMISFWITDSFERKDVERDILTNLLINLCKPKDAMLSQTLLIQGLELVLSTLEDAINDAPKAPHFLGRMFARLVEENVVLLSEIARILYEGGEEQGQLVEAGVAADILGSMLETIQTDKGDSALSEIRKSSNLKLEDFRPPNPLRSSMLEKFI